MWQGWGCLPELEPGCSRDETLLGNTGALLYYWHPPQLQPFSRCTPFHSSSFLLCLMHLFTLWPPLSDNLLVEFPIKTWQHLLPQVHPNLITKVDGT